MLWSFVDNFMTAIGIKVIWGDFPGGSDGKEPALDEGDLGSIPG